MVRKSATEAPSSASLKGSSRVPLAQASGAAWEGAVITQELYESAARNEKFVPVGFVPYGEARAFIPGPLRPTSYRHLGDDNGYEALLRQFTGQPVVLPEPVGQVPDLPPATGGVSPRRPTAGRARLLALWMLAAAAGGGGVALWSAVGRAAVPHAGEPGLVSIQSSANAPAQGGSAEFTLLHSR